jgi:hypothetical protein
MENNDNSEFEKQMIRGQLATHATLSKISERVNDIEAFVFGINDALIEKGLLQSSFLFKKIESVKKDRMDNGETLDAGVSLRVDNAENPLQSVNCEERLHICKAICCKLNFPLSQVEVEEGIIKWELGRPYYIRHSNDGFCCHRGSTGQCTVYNSRPKVCSSYSCQNDERIWKDFDTMVINKEWINQNLEGGFPISLNLNE